MNRNTAVAAVLAVCLLALSAAAHAIIWKSDFQSALKSARESGRPVMVDFYTDWCGWCKKLDADTYSNARVSSLSEKFVCVKVDAEKEARLAAAYKVTGYPTVLFIDGNGAVLQKVPGYLPADRFAAVMNNVLLTMPQPGKQTGEKGGGFVVLEDRPKGKDGKPLPAKTVGQEFVYNGYVESRGDKLLVQINYKGNTYFVTKGEKFAEYTVVSADKDKVVLSGGKGDTFALEFKKPFKLGEPLHGITQIFGDDQPGKTAAAPQAEPSAPEVFAGQARTTALAIPASVFSALVLVFYVYFAICLQVIAAKTGTANAWMAWLPVFNIFLMLNISKIKYRMFLLPVAVFALLVIPPAVTPINALAGLILVLAMMLNSIYFIFLMAYVWYRISVARGKSTGLSAALCIMMFVSPLNLIALGYMAFSK
jgi:thioredoxin-related protein